MKKIFFIFIFLSFYIIGYSQNSNDLIINRLLYKTSVQDRNAIKNYVLSKGKLKYYNSSYGFCHFYEFKNIDVYLLPVDSLKKKSEEYSDYTKSEKPESDKYALSLEYNTSDMPNKSTNTSNMSKIRADIDYILYVVKKQ